MRKIKSLLLFAFFCCLSGIVLGQTLTGQVLDNATKKPIAGASVVAGQKGTASDESGNFSIEMPNGITSITVSSVGFQKQTVNVGKAMNVTIYLQAEEANLDQVVVVGYGSQKKANLTGAVSSVDVKKVLQSRPVTDVGNALQGAVPGLSITNASGALGQNPTITLRGLSGSLNGSGAKPLILLDNVEIPSLNMVNPEDIESISVLKDAAATSIYGTRAAWGVILITSKGGKRNAKATITYSNNFAFSKPTTTPQVAPAVEGTEMAFKAMQRVNPSTTRFGVVGMYFDEIGIQKMREWQQQYGGQDLGPEMVLGRDFEIRSGQLYFYRPWDAGEMFMRDWMPQQKHDLSISGGNDKSTYFASVGYLGQTGVLKANPDKFDRMNATVGFTAKVNEWMDLRSKVFLSKTQTTRPYSFGGDTYDPWYYLLRWPAVYPYGTYEGKPFRSALTETEQSNNISYDANFGRINLGSTFKLHKDLTLDADYNYTRNNDVEHQAGGTVTAYNFWAGGGNLNYSTYTSPSYDKVRYTSWWNEMHTIKAFATYKKNIGEHDLKVIAGTDVEWYKGWSQYSERRTLVNPDQPELPLATGDQFVGGGRGEWATRGYFGRINYAFKDKFLLELNGRFDGSSKFPKNDQWAFFPSLSVGYVLSKEKFMAFSENVLSFLKLRASYGSIGNQDVGSNRFLSTLRSTSSGWVIGGNNIPTFTTPNYVSPSLTWETVSTLDFGVDARFFNNKLGISFDRYIRKTSDIITSGATLPATLGTAAPARNYAEITTNGWELAVDFRHSFNKDLTLNVTAVLSDFQEKVTRYANTTNVITSLYEGKVLGEIWGYETDRFFDKNDFEQDANGNLILQNGRYVMAKGVPSQSVYENSWFFYGPGDIKYKDLNNDGKVDFGTNTLDNPGDQKVIGNTTPRYMYGLNLGLTWKGIDFNMFVQGVGKRDYWANGPIAIPGYRTGEAWFAHQLDYWTPENPNAFYPRPTDHNNTNNARNFLPQTRYLLNMSYTRLKNLSIGYSLPVNLVRKIHLQRLRVYVSGENLAEIDHLKLPIDPEVDLTTAGRNDSNTFGRVYPFRRSYSFGVQVNF
ncbi:TonB-dependent receptor [Flavihumibacter rivuli]|uniref:SusC/RagA family TonB-linked outer membrane protein n=1 Tax=Flavihumibacter rivuli TaxID=2838156 RepID=UPI001BDE21F6|nr:TonB-dependent receptor [Flavihumibacter rivuli]ULQ57670.1 TonB-dependent receptor [Flavihumibacter rivuli]